MNVRDEYQAIKVKAAMLAKQAEGRDWTPEEMAQAVELKRQGDELEPKVKQYESDEQVKAYIADLGHTVDAPEQPAKTAASPWDGQQPAKKADLPTWATKSRRAGSQEWVKATADRISDAMSGPGGRKAVISGSIDVSSPISSDIHKLPEYPTRLLDLLVTRVPVSTATFTWFKQTVRTDNAAPVADNALKPTSVYTFTEQTGDVQVIAHLSEAIPQRYLTDYSLLGQFLQDEMFEGLMRAVETQVMTGNGTAPNLRGLLNTSGILTQAWSTNLLTTLRKATTALELYGEQPTAWAINPADVEVLDLLQDNEARHYFGGPSQQMGNSAPVWSIPIVKTVAVPAGTAVLGDWRYLELVVREDARLDIDTSGVLFDRNQFKARAEGRWGVAIPRPSAFCQVDTSAA